MNNHNNRKNIHPPGIAARNSHTTHANLSWRDNHPYLILHKHQHLHQKTQGMSLQGQLTTIPCGPFFYPVFTSGDLTATRAVVFIGGLTNGLGAVPFTYPLSDALGKAGWKL